MNPGIEAVFKTVRQDGEFGIRARKVTIELVVLDVGEIGAQGFAFHEDRNVAICTNGVIDLFTLLGAYIRREFWHYLSGICRVPDDQIAYRSYPLLAARELLQQFIREQVHGHQAA
nr:hypothetical protein [Chromohalobacter salexigens]